MAPMMGWSRNASRSSGAACQRLPSSIHEIASRTKAEATLLACKCWSRRKSAVPVTGNVNFAFVDAHDLVFIDIQYAVKGTNDRRNLVFPYYTIPDDGSDY